MQQERLLGAIAGAADAVAQERDVGRGEELCSASQPRSLPSRRQGEGPQRNGVEVPRLVLPDGGERAPMPSTSSSHVDGYGDVGWGPPLRDVVTVERS